MNKQQWKDLAVRLKNRQVILTAAILFSVVMLGLYVIRSVYPVLAASSAASMEIAALEKQRAMLEQQPVPVKVQESEIAAVLQRVPTRPEIPRFLYELLQTEGASGVVLQSYSTGTAAKHVEGQQQFIDTRTNSVQTQAAQPAEAVQANGLTELTVNLKVSGTYASLQQFLSGIQMTERLATVTSWAITANSGKTNAAASAGQAAAANPEEGGSEQNVAAAVHSMELVLSLYAAPGYEGKLGSLEQVSSPVSESRADPTLTDNSFYPLLKPAP
ncbi:Pilus assembly protein, PilO [Paenibacillus sp. UNCCL117]|uniref:type 4a pilus biogenesis protein PilO n=1 Tax=unclassified Paenibacillus TaxID=185978 RepID=UPI0008920B5F|nr:MULTISPECIES: type 4a pilus biogenesis protein PilO [unclassified Paenibacillus]SDC46935.1 Pilus assembly protein, PilO [Paenibacillus sp. cl123]SFW12217.1 Pilus assembly protein, PilO [Paenibacillus sp. UNCCL117]